MVNSIDTKSVIKIQGRVSQTYATSPLSWQTKETTTQHRRQTTTQFSYDMLISNIELIEGFSPHTNNNISIWHPGDTPTSDHALRIYLFLDISFRVDTGRVEEV